MKSNNPNNKNKIIDVAFILSLKHGFNHVSIKQLKEETGLSTGSIYYYFEDKNEILEYMVNKYFMNMFKKFIKKVKNFDGSFIEKIKFILKYRGNVFYTEEDESKHVSIRTQVDYKDYLILFISISHQHPEISAYYEIHDELYKLFYELIEEAIENNEINEDIDIEKVAIFLQTIFKGHIVLALYQPKIKIEKLVKSNTKLIWEVIKKS
ncbi:MAG: TetR/AcrR family transcriptional regulator [Methanobrevibacter sp.]|nr:TetR/AcrR family transcriptional regulator [Methanobrevibacter sp.]